MLFIIIIIIIIILLVDDAIFYDPERVFAPSSLDDIRGLIHKARKNGHKVRPLGSGHSWNTMAVSDDIYISLYNYRGLVNVDTDRKQSKECIVCTCRCKPLY